MRILHITAQKPNSTGSGVYMSGLIDSLEKLGHTQGVIAGIDIKDDRNSFDESIKYYPVIYNSESLPFPVMGMSDNMPYEATRYKDLTPEMVKKIKSEFLKVLKKAVEEFKPEIIICNHLYLITSFVREYIKEIKVVAICHGTCLRQLKSIDLEKDYIISNISKLEEILVLHQEQRKEVLKIFDIDENKVKIIGSGYDDKVFYNKKYKKGNTINITYAGKICRSKGLKSLLRAVDKLNYPKDKIVINFAGGGSDLKDVEEIKEMAQNCKYNVVFHGKLNHKDLADLFNKSQIFTLPSFYEGLPVVVLEALSCGSKVIVSDFEGLEEFIGNDINSSGNISYIKLPKIKGAGIPLKEELPYFEENIAKSLEKFIEDKSVSKVSLKNKTWEGLGRKIEKIIEEI